MDENIEWACDDIDDAEMWQVWREAHATTVDWSAACLHEVASFVNAPVDALMRST